MLRSSRQVLAVLVTIAFVSPATALPAKTSAAKVKPEVAGIVASAPAAAVREVMAPAGTTIYSGDTLRTFHVGAIIAIGESQIRFAAESRARLTRAQGRVQVEIQRGRISLRNSESSPVEARLADAVITAGDSSVVGIAVLNESKAMVAAEHGSVTLRTARENKTATLRAGESVEVTLTTEPAPQSGGSSSNARLLSPRKVAILGAVIIGGISFAAWLIQHDNDLPVGPKQDLISPYRLR